MTMTKNLPPMITWNDAWSVGVDVIDEEHKKLVDILQKLFGALITVQAKSYIKGLVDELMDYTHYHFKNEEAILGKYDYPHLEQHKAQHIALVHSLAGTKDIIQRQNLSW